MNGILPFSYTAMFSHVYEMSVIASRITASPFVACYLCSYIDETGRKVFSWVMDDVLFVTSPLLHVRAVQHGFSELADCDKPHIPPLPRPGCHWVELQRRAMVILSILDETIGDQ